MTYRFSKFIQIVFIWTCIFLSSVSFSEEYVKLHGISGEGITNKLNSLIDREQIEVEIPGLLKNIDKIFGKLSEVKDFYYSVNRTEFSNRYRNSDFYIPEKRIIVFTQEWVDLIVNQSNEKDSSVINRALQVQTSIIIHTLLGASGYHDEHYEKTLGLYFLLNLFPADKKPNVKFKIFKNKSVLIKLISEIFNIDNLKIHTLCPVSPNRTAMTRINLTKADRFRRG